MKKTCVQIRVSVRRLSRHPLTRRTLRTSKHLIRGATFGILPSTVNDVVVHHAPLSISEVLHVTQDTLTVASINALVAIAKSLV